MSFGRRPNPVFGPDYARARAVLLRARRRAGLSQRALAHALGKANSHVTRIERGQRRIDLLEFHAIARALGADPVGLFAELAAELERPECAAAPAAASAAAPPLRWLPPSPAAQTAPPGRRRPQET
jgi:transcriptional regulator with XRE-family HTH domain